LYCAPFLIEAQLHVKHCFSAARLAMERLAYGGFRAAQSQFLYSQTQRIKRADRMSARREARLPRIFGRRLRSVAKSEIFSSGKNLWA